MSSPLRILLIDDNPDDRTLVVRALRQEFPLVQVDQVIDAQGLAQALDKGGFDLVSTDYQLKWTDGLAVLKAVKTRYPDCPVIMFTGTGSEEIAVEAMKNGLDDYVLKSPKHYIRLPGAVKKALERAKAVSERKQAEENARENETRYRSLFENMLEGFAHCRMLYDHGKPEDFIYLDVNSAFERLTGLKNVVGRRVTEVIPDIRQANPELFEVYGRVVSTGKPERFETYLKSLAIWFSISVYSTQTERFIAVFDNITARKRAEEELRRAHAELRMLAGRLQEVQEAERKRIAREIHDELGQTLTVMKLDIGRLGKQLTAQSGPTPNAEAIEKIRSLAELVDSAMVSMRNVASALRPRVLDDLGLAAALESLAREFQARAGMPCGLAISPAVSTMPIDPADATAFFRIAQELLTNTARHAHASKVGIALMREDGALVMEVRDNGTGISEQEIHKSPSFGLLGIRERATLLGGTCVIHGNPGEGTTVTVRIPNPKL